MNSTTTVAARGTTAFFAQAVLSGIIRVVVIMTLTRILLQTEMGQVAILGILYGLMQFLGAMGLNHAAPLFIARAEHNGDTGQIRGLLQQSLRSIIGVSSLLTMLLLFLSPLFLTSNMLSVEMFSLLLLTAPLSSIEVYLDSFLMGRYRVRQLVIGRLFFDLSRMSSVVLFVHIGLGVTGVILGWFLSELMVVLYYLWQSHSGLDMPPTRVDMRPVILFALPSLIFQTIDVTIQNTDRVILLYLAGLSSLGVYDVMLSLLFMMSFVSLSVSVSLYPVLVRVGQGEMTSTAALDSKSIATTMLLRYLTFLFLPVSVIVAMNSDSVLSILIGSGYAQFPGAASSFAMLIVAYVGWGLTYALHTVLRSIGETRFFWSVGLVVIVIETVGCWHLTLLYGLLGAAIVRCLYILILATTALFRLRQLGIHVKRSLFGTVARITTFSGLAGYLVSLTAPSSLLSLLIVVALAMLLIVPLLILTGEAQPLDFKIARSVLPARIHSLIDRLERLLVR